MSTSIRSRSTWRWLAVLSLAWACAAGLRAAATWPSRLNYQGQLTDNTGVPMPDGSYSILFSIYNDPVATGGALLWSETQSVTLSKGLFNAVLGSVNPVALGAGYTGDLWVALKVGTDAEMTPRQQLLASVYAYNAQRLNGATLGAGANNIPQLDVNGKLPVSMINGGSISVPLDMTGAGGPYNLHVNNTGPGTARGIVADSATDIAVSATTASTAQPALWAEGARYGLVAKTDDNVNGVAFQANGSLGTEYASMVDRPHFAQIYGQAVGASTYGILGVNTNAGAGVAIGGNGGFIGVSGSGGTYGLYGQTSAPAGAGVYGANSASTGNAAGVWGSNPSGYGVYGVGSIGVYGSGTATGVQGVFTGANGAAIRGDDTLASGSAVFGHATASSGLTYGLHGDSASPAGLAVAGYNLAATGLAVGVYGNSASNAGLGVQGSGFTGVLGNGNGGSGYGVAGTGYVGVSGSGGTFGVYGAGGSAGLEGHNASGLWGVEGISNYGGVIGRSQGSAGAGYGVLATTDAPNGAAGYFESDSSADGIHSQTSSPAGYGGYFVNQASSGPAAGLYAEGYSTAVSATARTFGGYAFKGYGYYPFYGAASSGGANFYSDPANNPTFGFYHYGFPTTTPYGLYDVNSNASGHAAFIYNLAPGPSDTGGDALWLRGKLRATDIAGKYVGGSTATTSWVVSNNQVEAGSVIILTLVTNASDPIYVSSVSAGSFTVGCNQSIANMTFFYWIVTR